MLDFVLRICEFCARFCASDLQILCSILCFGFANFVLDFVLRICEFCARFCASDLRILCSILCFGFSDCAKFCARRIVIGRNQEHEKPGFGAREIRIWSTRNQEIFSPTQTTEIEVLVLPGPWFWCSRPLVPVLQALGSGAPGPWFWCSRPAALVQAGAPSSWFFCFKPLLGLPSVRGIGF